MANVKETREPHTNRPCDSPGKHEPRVPLIRNVPLDQRGYTRAMYVALCGATLAGTVSVTGCVAPSRLKAVPAELQDKAALPGFPPHIRTWGDRLSPEFIAECVAAAKREEEALGTEQNQSGIPAVNFLAVSGGGANGAFAAGLLCGWTAGGTRPQFSAVTGVSTGAMIAPFAFLGSKYDGILRENYTAVQTKDILNPRPILEAMFSDALADTKPLERLVDRCVDRDVLAAIADEYQKGRLLLFLTVDLDAQRPVIWNMTAIAASGHAGSLQLFRRVMLASASVPGAFPPVMIDVEVEGNRLQEMHVDGGVMQQVFFYPPSFDLELELRAAGVRQRDRRLYVIRNAHLEPTSSDVERRILKIAARAIQTLIQTQGLYDVHRLYETTQRDQVDFNVAYIPKDFGDPPSNEFDSNYMRMLFDRAFELAQNQYPWSKIPPDFETGPTAAARPAK